MPTDLGSLSGGAVQDLLHELQVHQIELEMQNEELRQKQVELDHACEMYFELYELAPVGYFALGETGEIRKANLTAANLLGVPRGSLTHQRFTQFILPEDQDLFYRHRQQLMVTHEPLACDLRMKKRDGTPFHAHLEATAFDESDGERVCRVVMNDVTERVQAELALRTREEEFRTLVEHSEDCIMRFDLNHRFTYLNPAGLRLAGLASYDLMGKSHRELGLPDDLCCQWEAGILKTAQTGKPSQIVVEWAGPEGVALLDTRLIPELGLHGSVRSVLAVSRDISRQRREEIKRCQLEELLQQSRRMESLGTLAGGVAHDMNNVLGIILSLASANLEVLPSESKTRQALQTIAKAAERGGKMVKSLLSFARRTPAESLELDMNTLLREEVSILERTTQARVAVEMDLCPGLRTIRGDASALAHALMNLCLNAVDAIPDNGTLTLRSRNVDNHWIEVVVEDTGLGMSKEVLDKAMDPFYTTKPVGKGTGLGLSMVYSTVQAHHGQIDIQSQPGMGTRVRLRFLAYEGVSDASQPEVGTVPICPAKSLSILVVDDDELIRCSMVSILELLAHRAISVASGEEALAMLESGYEPDVLILDMNMPGLGGAGTLPRLRLLLPKTPVLLATGRVDEFASDQAKAYPHVSLLPKPFTLEELRQQIDAVTPAN